MSDCLFCAIVAGDIPADIVWRNDDVVAFRDINPQAPVHVLVIPTVHMSDVEELALSDPPLAASMLEAATRVAELEGVSGSFRLVFNTGAGAGQSVFHAHAHVLGGRDFTWPPG
ncbi:MAG: histidine triad nucleotide-binding protein [Actinomycetes bacterium]